MRRLHENTQRFNRQPEITAAITVTSKIGQFAWSVTLNRHNHLPDFISGSLAQAEGQTSERVWLHALGMAYEWRDSHVPGARLNIFDSNHRRAAA